MPPSLPARSTRAAAARPVFQRDRELAALCKEAIAHHQAGRFAEAVHRYRRIIALNPALPDIHNNLGHALIVLGELAPAAAAFQRATELKSDFPEALCNWGLVLHEQERYEEAETKFRRAISVRPRFAGAYNNLGLLLKEKGRLQEARQMFEQAIDLVPKNFSYYDNLAAVRPFADGDPYLAALETAVQNSTTLPAADAMHLHFALAKAYDGLGRTESAATHLLNANRLKRRQIAYNEADTLGRMERLRALIDHDFIKAHQGGGDPSAAPVFIVGMMRSGTTLIEQILASHPKVCGAGEIPLLDRVAGTMRNQFPGVPQFPEMMLQMSADHFRTVGRLYLDRVTRRSPTAMRITDKMTVNFLFLGLIHLALPNATIIHAVRDPADTCLSCFSMHFTKGQEHTYDLAELGRYYRHYRDLMAHWYDVLPPGRIMDVHYEELVGDPEGVARRIVAHCGLAWDARCLDFQSNDRPVRTASAVQVRKPIYRNAIGRWRKYEAMLGPLFAELGPCGEGRTAAPAR